MILPNEIWLHVANLIPKDTLVDLYGVNKMFMDLALSEKYGEVQIGALFAQYDPYTACRYLDHLSQAHVSSRIQHLIVTLSFELFEQNPYQNRHLTRFLPGLSLRGLTSKQQDSLRQRQDILHNIRLSAFKFLKSLPSVNHLEINYDHALYPRALSSVFVSFLWRRFGLNLRTLTIRSSLAGIAGLMSSSSNLGSLEGIHLEFETADCNQISTPGQELQAFAVNTISVARFINSMHSSLRSLSFAASTSTGLRTSTLFQELGHFPKLGSLTMYVPTPRDGEDEELVMFLSLNASRLTTIAVPTLHSLNGTQLVWQNLRKLTILPSQHWAGSTASSFSQARECRLNTIQLFIPAITSQVTSIFLDDSFLVFADLSQILGILPSRLRHLRLKVVAIHPQLFISLHKHLPVLSSLEITARTAQHEYTEDGCYHCDFRRLTETDEQEPLQLMMKAMSSASFQTWPLLKLSITLEKCPIIGLEKAWDRMVREKIPSLELVEFEVRPPPSIASLSPYAFN